MFSFATFIPNFPLLNLQFHPCGTRTSVFRLRAKRDMKRASSEFPVLVGSFNERTTTSQGYMGVLGVSKRRNELWDSEDGDDFELESEVLRFMKSSKNPGAFPSKKELIDAGRVDLVDGIVRKGGWLCLGWDEEDEEGDLENGVGSLRDNGRENSGFPASSSVRHVLVEANMVRREILTEDVSGIEGILNGLERERSINLFLSMEDDVPIPNSSGRGDWLTGTSMNGTDAGLNRSSKPASLGPDDAKINELEQKLSQDKSFTDFHGSTHSNEPNTWRTWSSQTAGLSNMEFEAAEFRGSMDISGDDLQVDNSGPLYGQGESSSFNEQVNLCQLQSRLQHLKSELSSVLCTIKSSNTVVTPKDDEGPAEELVRISDAYEFQENKIMNAHDRLRSIRAKLAVVEGKMALAIIDAQRTVEYKQKRIEDAHRALRLLRNAYIVWPNSASEVLLAGSFDGWATQRKMEKSNIGLFSLQLKLYPGQYEIKFVVDGEWQIDPLRPIVDKDGYENNLLIIT